MKSKVQKIYNLIDKKLKNIKNIETLKTKDKETPWKKKKKQIWIQLNDS